MEKFMDKNNAIEVNNIPRILRFIMIKEAS